MTAKLSDSEREKSRTAADPAGGKDDVRAAGT